MCYDCGGFGPFGLLVAVWRGCGFWYCALGAGFRVKGGRFSVFLLFGCVLFDVMLILVLAFVLLACW